MALDCEKTQPANVPMTRLSPNPHAAAAAVRQVAAVSCRQSSAAALTTAVGAGSRYLGILPTTVVTSQAIKTKANSAIGATAWRKKCTNRPIMRLLPAGGHCLHPPGA